MSKNWLVDAHNVLHTQPALWKKYKHNRKEALESFILLMDSICSRRGKRATLIFDGHHLALSAKSEYCKWRFSGEKTADDVIYALSKSKGAASRWIIVSNDRELKSKVRNLGVTSVSVGSVLSNKKGSKGSSETVLKPDYEPDETEITLMNLALRLKSDE